MNGKSLKMNRKLCNEDSLIPFLNKASLLCLIWAFKLDFFKAVCIAFKYFGVILFLDALAIINQLKL